MPDKARIPIPHGHTHEPDEVDPIRLSEYVRQRVVFFDDFLGDTIKIPPWNRTVAVNGWSGILANGLGGIMDLWTGATINGSCRMQFGSRLQLVAAKKPLFQARAALKHLTQVTCFMGISTMDNNIVFIYSQGAEAGFWWARTMAGGVKTETKLMVADTDFHHFKIEVESSVVRFYVDDSLVATHKENIPVTQLDPELYVKTLEDADKHLYVDYIYLEQRR